jgi:hypothetical protein
VYNGGVRTRFTIIIGVWALAGVASGIEPGPASLARFEPARGCYLGAFIEHDELAHGDFDRFERIVGKRHACYVNYSSYGRPFPSAWVARVAAHGAAAHVGWEPNHGLDEVRDDAYLHGWARAAAACGAPLFLRFASEMNGNWMAYSGNPSLYIEKFRLVYRVMHAEAPNVAVVWCPFSSPRSNIPDYYPGDEFVDWVGVNIYSVFYHNADVNQSGADEDPRWELRAVYDRYADRKPVMICEYAASHESSVMHETVKWFALAKMKALYESLPSEFPRVKCVQWFSWNTLADRAADNDYSITDSASITGEYRRLTSGSWFLDTVIGQRRPRPPLAALPLPGLPSPARPPTTTGPTTPPMPVPGPAAPAPAATPGPPAMEDDDWLRPLRSSFGLLGLRPGQRVVAPVRLSVYHPPEWQVDMVEFLVNGQSVAASNVAPFEWPWNPARLEPGRYELAVRLTRRDGSQVTSPPLPVEVRRNP